MSPHKSGDAIDTDHVVYLYQRLMQHQILRGHSIEDRAAGLAYFILNDNGNVSLKDFVKTSGVEMKRVVRTAKKIAKFYRKSHIFAERNIPNMVTGFLDWFEENCVSIRDRRDFFNFVEFIQNKYNERDLRFADSQLATTLWIAGKLTDTPIRQIESTNLENERPIMDSLRRILIEITEGRSKDYDHWITRVSVNQSC